MRINLRIVPSVVLICGLAITRGGALADEVLKYAYQGAERTAALHQPGATSGRPAPLLIVLHGLGGTGSDFEKWSGFDAVADREGFVTVYPDAMESRWSYGRPIIAPMPKIGDAAVDDIGFLRLLIDDLISRGIADPTRIYVTGSSRGGLMAYTLACAMSDRIAAAAPVITGMTDHQVEDCHPGRAMPMVLIAGTNDIAQMYDGWIFATGRQLSVAETMEYWRVLAGCTGQEGGPFLPHLDPKDRTRVTVINWTGCRNGADIRFYKVVGGGHQIPALARAANPMSEQKFGLQNHDIEAAEEIWAFVRRFSLPPRRRAAEPIRQRLSLSKARASHA
jgi:polyhydroxybutyrate depolymerase